MAEEEAFRVTKQLLEAVMYIHESNKIIHRDINPENVLIKWNS